MRLKYKEFEHLLDISKTRKFRVIQFRNYFEIDRVKYHEMPSGALEMETIQGSRADFSSFGDFYLHLNALWFLNYTEYKFPESFFEREDELEEINETEFMYWSQGYIDSFKALAEDNLWKLSLNIADFEVGYRNRADIHGHILFGQSKENYFSYSFTSID